MYVGADDGEELTGAGDLDLQVLIVRVPGAELALPVSAGVAVAQVA